MPDRLLDAVAAGVRVFDLGRPLFQGMPQSPNHPPFRLALQRRHGDVVRADGGSAASETIITGGHVGTHIDALCHVSHDGTMFGGVDAATAQTGGRFSDLGVETVDPFVCCGVLLDIPSVLGIERCEPAYEITPDDLARAAGDLQIEPDNVVLIRTGWGQLWNDASAYLGAATGVPGIGEAGARWLAEREVRAAGADTIAFERLPAGVGHALLPVHRIMLVEHGIHLIETMDLEDLAAAGARQFTFILSPLKLVGGTGSPVRPLAVVSA